MGPGDTCLMAVLLRAQVALSASWSCWEGAAPPMWSLTTPAIACPRPAIVPSPPPPQVQRACLLCFNGHLHRASNPQRMGMASLASTQPLKAACVT